MAMTQPSYIDNPWATNGTKTTIPATQATPGDGSASWDKGFPPETAIPISQGGVPPRYVDFNGVLNSLSSFAWWQQRGGLFTYSNTIDYPVGAIVISGGKTYQCLQENGPGITGVGVKAVTNTSYWMAHLQQSNTVLGLSSGACFFFNSTSSISPSNADGSISDNAINLGQANRRWGTVYAGTGTINTSDERLKDNIESIPDAVLDAWGQVNWQEFQFKDAVAKKGDAARLHTGLIAQRIQAVFESAGLDASRYGLFCYDEWHDDDEGDRYSLRYEEALAMESAYQRRRADRLEARLAAIEERLALLDGDLK